CSLVNRQATMMDQKRRESAADILRNRYDPKKQHLLPGISDDLEGLDRDLDRWLRNVRWWQLGARQWLRLTGLSLVMALLASLVGILLSHAFFVGSLYDLGLVTLMVGTPLALGLWHLWQEQWVDYSSDPRFCAWYEASKRRW